jgi:tetratricopeptide (TPR) repeat protein
MKTTRPRRTKSLLVFIFVLTVFSCSHTKQNLKLVGKVEYPLKEYKHIALHGATSGMVNSWVRVRQGDLYTIVAFGSVTVYPGGPEKLRNITPEKGWILKMRVGEQPYQRILHGANSRFMTSGTEGYLYFGIMDGTCDTLGHPDNPQAYRDNTGNFELDLLVWDTQNTDEIQRYLQDLKKEDPISKETLSMMRSLQQYRCELAPRTAIETNNIASVEERIARLKEAISLCPDSIEAHEMLGRAYFEAGESENALAVLTQVKKMGSWSSDIYYVLANIFFDKGDYKEAYDNIKTTLAMDPDLKEAVSLRKKIEKETDWEGPKIILFEPSEKRGISIVHHAQSVQVRGIAIDKNPIDWVTVNENHASVDHYGYFMKEAPLATGTNRLLVKAADSAGNISEVTIEIEHQKTDSDPAGKVGGIPFSSLYRKSHAVIIGINDYEKWPALEFAVNDAIAVRRRLERSGFDEITVLINQEATQKKILTELYYTLPKKVKENDRVLIFFAGHGETEDIGRGVKRGHIIPVDADTSELSTSAISMEQIKGLSGLIPAKHILYVMDSCYSGLGLNRSQGISPQFSGYLQKVSSLRVVQIVTAGGKGEQVTEIQGHGLFTSFFLKALAGEADIDHDGFVTGTELGAFLRPAVSNASNNAQTPLFGRLEGEGEFIFRAK